LKQEETGHFSINPLDKIGTHYMDKIGTHYTNMNITAIQKHCISRDSQRLSLEITEIAATTEISPSEIAPSDVTKVFACVKYSYRD
jgi:hypothetical protein